MGFAPVFLATLCRRCSLMPNKWADIFRKEISR
jgi:hypothetical protein